MADVVIEALRQTPVEAQRVELVERKGVGHPDSICDAIAEAVSLALCREYLAVAGRILHHNADKGLLVAGHSEPRTGGGSVIEPMRLVFGDRAIAEHQGRRIDVAGIAEAAARDWVRHNLHHVDPVRHVVFQSELKPGSPELTDIFARKAVTANDTSAAVGYAPLSETERMVLAAEHHLNSAEFKRQFPEAGEDVKVMGFRRDRELTLTVALAFVDRHVADAKAYFARKEAMRLALEAYLAPRQQSLDRVRVNLNTLDDPARGDAGMYLTVLGTSAEGGDSGAVGRGNRVNGVISLNRPMGTEAAAGKNPVSHPGKIYTLLAHELAARIHDGVPGVREVYVWLCSGIGQPLDRPLVAAAQIVPQAGAALADIQPAAEAIIENGLSAIPAFSARLARGELPVW